MHTNNADSSDQCQHSSYDSHDDCSPDTLLSVFILIIIILLVIIVIFLDKATELFLGIAIHSVGTIGSPEMSRFQVVISPHAKAPLRIGLALGIKSRSPGVLA